MLLMIAHVLSHRREHHMGSTLHVDGLLTSVSEQELKDMFTQLGNVGKANGRWKTK